MVSCGLCGPSNCLPPGWPVPSIGRRCRCRAEKCSTGAIAPATAGPAGRRGRRQNRPRPESLDCGSRWRHRPETAPAPGCPRPRQAACSDRLPAAVPNSDRSGPGGTIVGAAGGVRWTAAGPPPPAGGRLSGGRLDRPAPAVACNPGERIGGRRLPQRILARRADARRGIARQRRAAGSAGKQVGDRRVPRCRHTAGRKGFCAGSSGIGRPWPRLPLYRGWATRRAAASGQGRSGPGSRRLPKTATRKRMRFIE